MSRFHVGQRVRIKRAENLLKAQGRQAEITAYLFENTRGHAWALDIDGIGDRRPDGAPCWAYSDQLEPATDSYDLSTWDKCVWQPEHLRANA